ncbi:MAG: GTPase HflX [Armatimonadetes bacterium]|nr:GTPase HflX [Armatimonadota bacterium]
MSNHPQEKLLYDRAESGLISTRERPERAVLAQLIVDKPAPKNNLGVEDDEEIDSLEELAGLAHAAGTVVVARVTQKRHAPDSATLFGKGKVEELQRLFEAEGAEVLIVDCDLTPAQGRNLENALKTRVIDRTELILDIFARRAQTKQAKLQVELAQLRYQLPRLKRLWSHLERQGGSLGLRGPGETQLETDKNLARQRIYFLEKQLESIRAQKEVEQAGRREFDLGALVGYTNVGKSALLNALSRPTGRGVLEADMLFATLGATTRKVELGGGRTILLSDTVGLVRRLPHHLVESFHSTLAEVDNADFLLFVAGAPDPELEDKLRAVRAVLEELGVFDKPHLLVLNQCDLLSAEARRDLELHYPHAIFTSALSGEGLDDLKERIFQLLDEEASEITLELPAEREETGKVLAELARHGRILGQDFASDQSGEHPILCVKAKLAKRWWELVGVENYMSGV